MYIDARLRAAGESLQQMQQLVAESKKRFVMFYACVQSMQCLLVSMGRQLDRYLAEILQVQFHLL
jgi:hypothetical protein